MSRYFPHTRYHEDQPLSHTILYVHVLTRGFQAGSVIGSGVGTTLSVLRHLRVLSRKVPPSAFTATLLRSTGVGAVVGTGLIAIGMPIRMWGREEIEWQDRSWRLMENKGQLECDDWTYGGMAVGLLGSAATGKGSGWRGAVGSVGLGTVAGMLGYLGWRYGVKGGKFEEESTHV